MAFDPAIVRIELPSLLFLYKVGLLYVNVCTDTDLVHEALLCPASCHILDGTTSQTVEYGG